jgi:uncharacterized membrane protein YfcA
MPTLLLIGLAGLAAQLVDGSLGMGYGLTSSTLLIAAGLTPALASASVHLAEIGTSAVSGLAHHRFGNVDWKVVARIAIPGGLGAFAGATFLSSLSTEAARPIAGTILLILGVYVFLRHPIPHPARPRRRFRRCDRWWWVGPSDHTDPARRRSHGAEQGHRHGQHE